MPFIRSAKLLSKIQPVDQHKRGSWPLEFRCFWPLIGGKTPLSEFKSFVAWILFLLLLRNRNKITLKVVEVLGLILWIVQIVVVIITMNHPFLSLIQNKSVFQRIEVVFTRVLENVACSMISVLEALVIFLRIWVVVVFPVEKVLHLNNVK